MTASPSVRPALRDPAWTRRVAGTLVLLALAWPLLVATEFAPWRLLDPQSLRPTLAFLATFLPPAHDPEFLRLVARETWRTVAIATAGMTLAFVLAVPL